MVEVTVKAVMLKDIGDSIGVELWSFLCLEAEPAAIDPVKLAFEKAKSYKKSLQCKSVLKSEQNPVEVSGGASNGNGVGVGGGGTKEVLVSVKVAMEKAKEYKVNKGVVSGGKSDTISGLERGNGVVEKKVNKKKELSVLNIDFIGLEFADKTSSRGLPPGLAPIADPFPVGDLPEVEFIVGDTSRFEDTTSLKPELTQEDDSDLYKPKVSSWGVFPRPNDISKTFGGGRVICPGEVLETAEEKAARETRTRQLLAAYKSKIGLNIDPKLKSECEEALKDGDSLMNLGKLK
ncbi:cytochrome C oxidase subunit [Fagus crenata]